MPEIGVGEPNALGAMTESKDPSDIVPDEKGGKRSDSPFAKVSEPDPATNGIKGTTPEGALVNEQPRAVGGSPPSRTNQTSATVGANGNISASDTGGHGIPPQNDSTPTTDNIETNHAAEDEFSEGDSIEEYQDTYQRNFADSERLLKLAPKRRKQHNQYMAILEERISILEDRFRSYAKEPSIPIQATAPPDGNPFPPPSGPPKPPTYTFALRYCSWTDFYLPDEKHHIISVLVGEPGGVAAKKPRRQSTLFQSETEDQLPGLEPESAGIQVNLTSANKERDLEEEVKKMSGKYLPERILLRSYTLRLLLQKALGSDTHAGSNNVVLRPYKGFLQNEVELRHMMDSIIEALDALVSRKKQQAEEVASKVETTRDFVVQENESVISPLEPRDSRNVKEESESHNGVETINAADWEEVLHGLELHQCSGCNAIMAGELPTISDVKKCFAVIEDLLDNIIKPVNDRFRKRSSETIKFSNLWHLFYTGDEIVVRRRVRSQDEDIAGKVVLKVLRTSGGRRVINKHNVVFPPPPFYGAPPVPQDEKILPVNGINPFCIYAYYLDYDGSKLVPVRRRFVIAPYNGERKIVELVVHPVEYTSSKELEREVLVARGKKFVNFSKADSVTYVDCIGQELRTKEDLNDKVIVDTKEYFRDQQHMSDFPRFAELDIVDSSETATCGPNCMPGGACNHRSENIIPDQSIDEGGFVDFIESLPEFELLSSMTEPPSDWVPDYRICTYRVFAYKLRSREWVQVHVDSLHSPDTDEVSMGFKQLVIPKDHKDILESQVREHFRKRESHSVKVAAEDDMDLIRGKGQGLIILLHGAPGVGKTATAECIADLMKKPLYPITCGDLGSTAEEVERNLKKHFALASRWDCVMLLDEADVFLAKRKHNDLHRNSIVSVFLRMLEYYKGLLFLTTNRIGSFDEAFKSRVHISLFYPNFDKDTTIKVWQTFIEQTEQALQRNDRTRVKIKTKDIIKFAEEHWDEHAEARWNGRQIRNAFHTAVAMAEFKARGGKSGKGGYKDKKDVKIVIRREHFEKIAKTVKEFDEYMHKVVGMRDDAKAAKDRIRANTEVSAKRKETSKTSSNKKTTRKKETVKSSDDSSDESSEEESGVVAKSKGKEKKPMTRDEESESSSETDSGSD